MPFAGDAQATTLIGSLRRNLDDAIPRVRHLGSVTNDCCHDPHQFVVSDRVVADNQLRRLGCCDHLADIANQRFRRVVERGIGRVTTELKRHLAGEHAIGGVLTEVLDELDGERRCDW